jgi:hypothetical protein
LKIYTIHAYPARCKLQTLEGKLRREGPFFKNPSYINDCALPYFFVSCTRTHTHTHTHTHTNTHTNTHVAHTHTHTHKPTRAKYVTWVPVQTDDKIFHRQ